MLGGENGARVAFSGVDLGEEALEDAVGGLGQRLLLLEELHPFAELGDDLRADLRQALERLRKAFRGLYESVDFSY